MMQFLKGHRVAMLGGMADRPLAPLQAMPRSGASTCSMSPTMVVSVRYTESSTACARCWKVWALALVARAMSRNREEGGEGDRMRAVGVGEGLEFWRMAGVSGACCTDHWRPASDFA